MPAPTIERIRALQPSRRAISDAAPRARRDGAARIGRLAGTSESPSARRPTTSSNPAAAGPLSRRARRCALFIEVDDRPLYTVNGQQIISEIVELCGGRNVFADLNELAPAIGIEAVIAANPQAIVSTDDTVPDAAADWARWRHIEAVRTGTSTRCARRHRARDDPSHGRGRVVCRTLDTARQRLQAAAPRSRNEECPHFSFSCSIRPSYDAIRYSSADSARVVGGAAGDHDLGARRTHNAADFAIANRRLGPWLVTLSYAATGVNAWMLMTVAAAAFIWGLSAAWIWAAVVLGCVVNLWYVAPRLRAASIGSGGVTVIHLLGAEAGDRLQPLDRALGCSHPVLTLLMQIAAILQFAGVCSPTSVSDPDNVLCSLAATTRGGFRGRHALASRSTRSSPSC